MHKVQNYKDFSHLQVFRLCISKDQHISDWNTA